MIFRKLKIGGAPSDKSVSYPTLSKTRVQIKFAKLICKILSISKNSYTKSLSNSIIIIFLEFLLEGDIILTFPKIEKAKQTYGTRSWTKSQSILSLALFC